MKMILLILLITASPTNADDNTLCDERYCLHAVVPQQNTNSFENAKNVCTGTSWLLEIYDESVWRLLQNLKKNATNIEWSKNILLGMKKSNKGWQWMNNKSYDDNRNKSNHKTIENQDDSNKVVTAVLKSGTDIHYVAKDIYSESYVICNKKMAAFSCTGFEYNGSCFYAILISSKWYGAHNRCIENESSMANLEDVPLDELNYSRITKNNTVRYEYWIGLSRNTWKWVHSDSFVTYNKWDSVDMNKEFAYVKRDENWITTDWQTATDPVIVCMSESTVHDVGKSFSSFSSSTSVEPTVADDANALSIGAKAGIGVGVSLFIIIIIIIGVLIFKFFHHFKKPFKRESSKNLTTPESPYGEVVKTSRETISPDIFSKQLEYADLDFRKHVDANAQSANNFQSEDNVQSADTFQSADKFQID